jgi:hypothetical protein
MREDKKRKYENYIACLSVALLLRLEFSLI